MEILLVARNKQHYLKLGAGGYLPVITHTTSMLITRRT